MAEQSSEYSTSAVSLFKEKKLLIPSCVHRRLLRLSQLKPIQKVFLVCILIVPWLSAFVTSNLQRNFSYDAKSTPN